jgi:hypothetical protein
VEKFRPAVILAASEVGRAAGECGDDDTFGARGEQDAGGFAGRGARGHDVVHQQHAPTSDDARSADGECAAHILKALGRGQAGLPTEQFAADEGVLAKRQGELPGQGAANGGGGVGFADDSAQPMYRNRGNEFGRFVVGMAVDSRCQELAEGAG